MLVAFEDTNFAVEVPERRDFLDALRGAAGSWSFAPGSGKPLASVQTQGPKYRLVSAEGEGVETTAVGAACGAVAEVIEGYVAENPSRLCLHCGAVEFGGRLVVFPSTYRAGKSTLVARLAAAGHRVFGDDVLPLSDDDARGFALGLAPRLRLPLPDNASNAFRDFVHAHAGPGDGYYQYLALPPDIHAKRGEELPLGAVVLLNRQPDGVASLARATRSAALRALITRNFAREEPAGELLDRLHAVMARLPLFALRYSNVDDAVATLERFFAAWPPRVGEIGLAGDIAEAGVVAEMSPVRVAPSGVRLRRNPAIRLRAVDDDLFLTDDGGFAIYHLNAVGAGLWNLLAEPTNEAEAVEVLCGAFPDADAAAVAQDVRLLFAALLAGGFARIEGRNR